MVEAHRGQRARQGRATTSLSWIVNAFKGWCTREFKNKIWQPNYYEHIIRSEKELEKIREYIENNPLVEKLEWSKFENKD
jgi:REP element-mobilizing transposase RayT